MSGSSESRSFSRLRQIDKKFKLPVPSKSKIKYPSAKDVIFHRRHVPRTLYYMTSGHEHLGNPRNVNDEQSPFLLPPKSHMLAYYQCCKDWARQSFENRKSGAKAAQIQLLEKSKDILRRLRVDVEAEADEATKHVDLDKATVMTDIDADYFTELVGRMAVGERFSRQRYIEDARQVLKTRLLIGEERDDCIRIDQQFDEERRRLKETKEKYRIYVNGFEEFLSKDHEESMKILDKANDDVKLTYETTTIRNQLSKDLGQLRREVYTLEESWRTVKMCQKFLYQISPNAWRLEHDWIHRTPGSSSIASIKLDDLLGRYKIADNSATLETLIEMFEADIAEAHPPQLYFKNPDELMRVFRSMELQNLNALIHLESLAGPMAEMTSNIMETEYLIKREISEIEESLTDIEESIRTAEERAVSLENYANHLLHGVFRDLVCSEPVLYLRVFIEDTFENCVESNDANLDTYSMMRLIEKTYEELNMQLDNLPHEIVEQCEKEGFRQEMKAMKDAEDAARKFELMHRLLAALQRILEPPKPKSKSHMAALRTTTISTKPKAIPSAPLPVREDEMIFLNFFTNYCKLDDPHGFESKFPDDFDLTFTNKIARDSEELGENNENNEAKDNEHKFCYDIDDTTNDQ